MKYDMSGAGSVLGTIKAVAQMGLPINVVGVIPSCENMPGGNAIKPGDIVTSMSGQTIEILNTDAEGRLILCDALTYVERFEPAAVIDIATLTGACVIALGARSLGSVRERRRSLPSELLAAGQESGTAPGACRCGTTIRSRSRARSRTWPTSAAVRQAASPPRVSWRATQRSYKWAHLDVAGTAWRSGKDKGSTARPVPLLTTFLMQQAGVLG